MRSDVELISVGTELLSGRTLNTHAQTLGAALTAAGLRLVRDTTVPDETDRIQSTVREALERADLVVVSGGLGPTCDDITREALAGLLNRSIVPSPQALAELHRRFRERGRAVTPAAERQALVLEGAETLLNAVGMAPGERIELPGGQVLFVLPGPPAEFAAVLQDHLLPFLKRQFPLSVPLELCVLTAHGIGESDIVTRLEAAAFTCPDLAIGFYPGGGRVEIRLSAPPERRAYLAEAERALREILSGYLRNEDSACGQGPF